MSAPTVLIKEIEGEVNVTRNGEVVNIKAGDTLLPGDVVTTGTTGRLALEFPATEGLSAAAGVMAANGKITLGEQTGAKGTQIVVMEDGECFEFTSEITEDSVALEGNAASLLSGLFGPAGAAGGPFGAAAAAAAFLAGGGSDSDSDGSTASSSGAGGGTLGTSGNGLDKVTDGQFTTTDSPQSPQEFADKNLTQENAERTIITPVQEGAQTSAEDPQSTPDNVQNAGGEVGYEALRNVNDAMTATTGEGSTQSTTYEQVESGLAGTPLGEPLSPVTSQVGEVVNHELTLDEVMSALPSTDTSSMSPVSTVVNTVTDAIEPVTSQNSELSGLANALNDGAAQIDTALTPVYQAIPSVNGAQGLSLSDLTAEGPVTTIVDTVTGVIEPVTSQSPELTAVVDTLHDVAVQVDTALQPLYDALTPSGSSPEMPAELSGIESQLISALSPVTGDLAGSGTLPTPDSIAAALENLATGDTSGAPTFEPGSLQAALAEVTGGGGGDTDPTGVLIGGAETVIAGVDGLSGGDLPTGEVGGLIGTVESLASQLQGASSGDGGESILSDVSSGISSAANGAGADLPVDINQHSTI